MGTSDSTTQPLSWQRGTSPRSRVAIVTDSVAQVSPELAHELGITVIPLKLVLGGREYRDGVDITPTELYRRMQEEKILPHTSSPSVGEYQSVFLSLLHEGAEAVVCLTISSQLSMAYNAARIAAETARSEYPDRKVEVIDTRIAARAEGFIAMQAARVAAEGGSCEQVVAAAQAARERVGLVATVDTLEYLARGGRVSLAASLLGSLLQVKPLLTILGDGSAACIARKRTKRAALEYMVEYVADRMNGRRPLQLAVMQAAASEDAQQLQQWVTQMWPSAEIAVTDFTPVMGGHTGPGLIGLAFHHE